MLTQKFTEFFFKLFIWIRGKMSVLNKIFSLSSDLLWVKFLSKNISENISTMGKAEASFIAIQRKNIKSFAFQLFKRRFPSSFHSCRQFWCFRRCNSASNFSYRLSFSLYLLGLLDHGFSSCY